MATFTATKTQFKTLAKGGKGGGGKKGGGSTSFNFGKKGGKGGGS